MKKRIINTFLIIILMLFCYQLLTKSFDIKIAVLNSFNLWKNNIFPFLFPFFVISDLLINLNTIELINKYLSKLMYKLFKINSASSFIFFLSIISGIPSNAKYINTLLKSNQLNEYEAKKIILFTHFCNPLFVIGIISSLLNNKRCAISILCIHYITNIIIGLIIRNYHPNNISNLKTQKNTNNFLKTISTSISNSINTLLLILGVITFFSCVVTIINLNLNSPLLKGILSGILEMTQGINQISYLNISTKLKCTLITFFISFGGLSSHIQVMSILEDTNIKYLPYLLARIFHASIASIIIYLIS